MPLAPQYGVNLAVHAEELPKPLDESPRDRAAVERPPREFVELHATLEHSWAAQREHWQHEQQPNAALRCVLSTPPESVAIVLESSRAESEDDRGKQCALPYAMVAHDEGRVCTEG